MDPGCIIGSDVGRLNDKAVKPSVFEEVRSSTIKNEERIAKKYEVVVLAFDWVFLLIVIVVS